MSDLWGAVGAISAAVGALVIIVAGVYAHFQVREARFARNVGLLLAFHEQYHSMPVRTFRQRLLRGELGNLDELDGDDGDRLWDLIDQLQLLGVLVDRGLVDFELVYAAFHSSPLRVWEAFSL